MDMEVAIAIGHILGSIVSIFVIDIIWVVISSFENESITRKSNQEFALVLGVPPEEVEDKLHFKKTLEYMEGKYTTELFRNRFSDMCGSLRTIWRWIGALTKIIVLASVIWFTISDSLNSAIFAWSITAIHLFFSISTFVFSYACLLLTGRFPGQARAAREHMAEWIRNNGELAQRLLHGE